MSDQKTEFSREVNLQDIGTRATHHKIKADAAERDALAERLGLPSLTELSANVQFAYEGRDKGMVLKGHLKASGAQACTVSLIPMPFDVEENLSIRFLPEERLTPELEEENLYTLDSQDLEPMPVDGLLDLGELIAQYMVLSLDPYPRAEGANLEGAEGKGFSVNAPLEKKPNPFAELAKLRDKT